MNFLKQINESLNPLIKLFEKAKKESSRNFLNKLINGVLTNNSYYETLLLRCLKIAIGVFVFYFVFRITIHWLNLD
ncbi:MAG: hypothetical protein WC974_09130 [Thermoplasmata archaeon]